jgi:hypothetical protein
VFDDASGASIAIRGLAGQLGRGGTIVEIVCGPALNQDVEIDLFGWIESRKPVSVHSSRFLRPENMI